MSLFYIIAANITLIVIFILVRPFLNNKKSNSHARNSQNIHYAQQRLQELELQLSNGTISENDYASLKSEVESTLAADLELSDKQAQVEQDTATESANQQTRKPNSKPIVILLCLCIPLASFSLYKLLGTPQAIDPAKLHAPQADNSTAPNAEQLPSPEQVEQMLVKIEQRLQEKPDDVQGWQILARTYLALGKYQKSITANKKLLELQGDNANIYAALADAGGLQNQGHLEGEPEQYIEKALSLNPQQPQALWLAGLLKMQQGNAEQARTHWNTLMPLLDSQPEQQQELKRIIQQSLSNAINPQAIAKTKQPTSEQTPELSSAQRVIAVNISIAPDLLSKSKPQDSVFVFAKAQQGPPAPLAVKRLTVADLPTTISLSDKDAMMPQLSIAKFDTVLITARISKSGEPLTQSGDFESQALVVDKTQTTVDAIIDTVVK